MVSYQLLETFMEHMENVLSPRTKKSYYPYIELMFRYCNPLTVTEMELASLFQKELNHSASTATMAKYSLARFFKWLKQTGQRSDDPSSALPDIKIPKRVVTLLNADTVKILETRSGYTALDKRNHAIILLMLDCGLRVEEVSTLPLSAIKDTHVQFIGKSNKERVVPMSKRVKEAIQLWLRDRWMWNPLVDNVFITQTGKAILIRNIQGLLEKKANTHPHALRTYFATKLADNSVDINIIRELMGHESILTTQKYINLSATRKEKEYRRVME